jgi:hypothetical protein
VKIDDVAKENWKNDRALNGTSQRTRAEHFSEQVRRSREDVSERLKSFLREVWHIDSEGKEIVIQSMLDRLQVFPVSAPQYRLLVSGDADDERPFLPTPDSSNIPELREAVALVARRCLADRNRRYDETSKRFFGQLRARLELLSAQRNEEQQAEEELTRFKAEIEAFIGPLQREFDHRRGGFRAFLRKTVPVDIAAKTESAAAKARKAINSDLRKLQEAHWKTLQAAVRKEGTFYGSRHINLPHDFALRFEEPVAEVWSRSILAEVRRETREFADYQSGAVKNVLEWARGQGVRRSTRLLEALVESVDQDRKQVDAVGRDAIDELRDKVRAELIKKIEAPIRRKCQKFVGEKKDFGLGVKRRILELFAELAEEVIEAASLPATTLLVERFKEVEQEIVTAFGEHREPLGDAANALVQRHEKSVKREDAQLALAIESAIAATPGGATA